MARQTAPLVAVLATTLLLVGSAAGDPGTDKARLDARIGELRTRADAAAGSEGVLTSELSGLTAQVRSAEQAVATEQARLSELESALAAERARLAALEQRISDETARLVVLEHQYATALIALENRVRAIYESDTPDLIGFALGTTSFSDLMDNLDLLNRIGQQDERIASSLARARSELEEARAETRQARDEAAGSEARILARTVSQRAVRDRIVANRDALASAERAKQGALANVREDRASFVAEADGLAAQSAALAATIERAQSAPVASSTGEPASVAAGSGQLSWPVAGAVTSGFGSRWGRAHEGIDIGVGTGTPVRAAAAGVVVYAGWMSGYGNVVVIDHGNGLSTAYAHNSGLLVGQGAAVARGVVVALSGSTGHSTGPHVHFEVRVGGTPVDPLGYL